jgi:predicted cobalt transporter CbtA
MTPRSKQDKRRAVAAAAARNWPQLPDDPAAKRRQAYQAWKVTTVVAAADGMDAAWFTDCMQALGLL